MDLATLAFIIRAVKWLAPDFDYQWLIEEAQRNVPLELDFRQEAANAARCRRNLESAESSVRGATTTPRVLPALSSARVLTMEFVEGVLVTDREGLRRLGVAPAAVAARLSRTFNEMIFRHGYVHCDPHAANMLVRRRKGADWELVLLDHGLYRQLDDALRLDYAGLWLGLVLADEAAIRRHSARLGAEASVPLFAGMLTQRPWNEITRRRGAPQRLRLRGDELERRVIAENAQRYAAEITRLLRDMPRPLLLLLKTNDCLRALDRELGAPVSNFVITARECRRAVARHELGAAPGAATSAHVLRELVAVESRLAAMRLLSSLAALWERVFFWRRAPEGADGLSEADRQFLREAQAQDVALPPLT